MHRQAGLASSLRSTYNAISFPLYGGGGCKICTFGDAGKETRQYKPTFTAVARSLTHSARLSLLRLGDSASKSQVSTFMHYSTAPPRPPAYLDARSLPGRNNLFAAILIRAVFTPPIWLGNLARPPLLAGCQAKLPFSLSFALITCLPTKLPSHTYLLGAAGAFDRAKHSRAANAPNLCLNSLEAPSLSHT